MALRARPIDPVTLADVPGYAPISFEHHYQAAVRKSDGLIAAILWPGGSTNYGGTVHLIDTRRWTDRVLDLKVDAYTSPLRFDASGASVYWAQPVWFADTGTTTALWRLDVAAGSAREIVRLPPNLYARDVRVLDGRVAIYAEPGPGNVTIGGQGRDPGPSVFVIDPASARMLSVALPVRAGQYQDASPANADEPWRQIAPGLAWDPSHRRLFVADAESERIFHIDLDTGSINGPFEPKPRRSLVDALWALVGGSTAQAKMVSADRQQAELSADGRYLYVSGVRSTFAKGSDGKYHEQIVPLDLRVIDTFDMVELARTDAAATPLWLAPDAATLLYGTSIYDTRAEGYATRSDFAVHVVDPLSLRDRKTLSVEGSPWLTSFDAGRHLAYVSWTSIVGGTLSRATVLTIDLATDTIVSRRDLDRHYAEVLLIPAR